MKFDAKSTAEKAMKGDKGALEILILTSPPGHMKNMSDKDYAKKVYDEGGYSAEAESPDMEDTAEDAAELGEEYADKISALEGVLSPFVMDDAKEAASAICKAIKSGAIPGISEGA
jgi:hypothetical protein